MLGRSFSSCVRLSNAKANVSGVRLSNVKVNCMMEGMARTPNQVKYVKLLKNNNVKVLFVTGPAGCGKTLIGCSYALQGLMNKDYQKIIITRPTVSMSEEYGYLPGKIDEKLHPWLIPIYDSFNSTKIKEYMQNGKIEIAPLGFIRGRTFHNSFVMVDEAQNIDSNQMKTLLTRIGQESKMVLVGDPEQCDLKGIYSGLSHFIDRLKTHPPHPMIQHLELGKEDIQRSEVVREILNIYHNNETYEDEDYEY